MLTWTALASLLLLPTAVEEAEGQARLEAIEQRYAQQPGERWEREALVLSTDAPESQAAGRALVWLGALALRDHRDEQAAARFAEARRRFQHGPIGPLASRGLGDVAQAQHRWGDAIAHYDEALVDASPLLRYELDEKRAMAAREQLRARLELGAWLLAIASLAALAWPLRTWRPALSHEAKLLAPVYVLFLAAVWGRDVKVQHAMEWIALGSLVLISLGRGAPRTGRRARDALLLGLGTLAVLFIAARRAGIVDVLGETLHAGAAR